MKQLVTLVLLTVCQMHMFSQIISNEFIFANDSLCQLELYNNSDSVISVSSILVQSDTLILSQHFENFLLQPFALSVINLSLHSSIDEFYKIDIIVKTISVEFKTSYSGFLLKGESIGRYPDLYGDLVVYSNSQTSPGVSNFSPGLLVKKSSKTKFSPRDSSPNASLYYDSMYWIFGGWDYDVDSSSWSSKSNIWRSYDGIDWELVNPNPPFPHYSTFVVFWDKIMVFYRDTAYTSQDGLSWDKIKLNPFGADGRYIVFKNKLYWFGWDLMGESEDGINWTIHQTNFPCDEILNKPALVTSGSRLWMYGGLESNSVWYSFDGMIWVKVLDNAPWSKRKWFNYSFFDGKMWMISGNDGIIDIDPENYGNLCDFWYSSDGINWDQLKTDSSYTHRHASFLWNDGQRLLISSGFGNGTVNRMYNDVWELSVNNLFLVADTANRNLELSIFPDIIAKYSPEKLDSRNLTFSQPNYSFSAEDAKWLSKKISIGNSINSSNITLKDSIQYDFANWSVNALSQMEFKNNSVLGKNPTWKSGSSLVISGVTLSPLSFQILNPYNLQVENSTLRFSKDLSLNKAIFTNSSISSDSMDSLIIRAKWFSVNNLDSSEELWLTNFDSERLFINNSGQSRFIPNLLIRDENIDLQSENIQVNKIRFLNNVSFKEKLHVNSSVEVTLSNSTYSERILNNFCEIPESVVLDDNSSFVLDQDFIAPNLVLSNKGLVYVGSNEIKLKGYNEIGSNAFINLHNDGSFTSGLTINGNSQDISLTFTLDNPHSTSIKVNLSRDFDISTEDSFRFFLPNTDEILNDHNRILELGYLDKSLGIEPLGAFQERIYKLSIGLTVGSVNETLSYNYVLDNMTDSMFLLASSSVSVSSKIELSKFSEKRVYSFFRNPFQHINHHKIFPNPNQGVINIYSIENFIIEIFDMSGRKLFQEINSESFILYQRDFSRILNSSGTYFFVLTDRSSGKRKTQKIIVVK